MGGSISSIKTSGTSQTFTYSLTGVDPSCSSPSSAINSCGIHIHAGTSCTENAQGHYYTGTVTADPWTTVVYTAVVYTAGGSKTVNTGATNVQIRGRTFIIHDRAGVRVACAKITAKPASSACSVPLSESVPALHLQRLLLNYCRVLSRSSAMRSNLPAATATSTALDYRAGARRRLGKPGMGSIRVRAPRFAQAARAQKLSGTVERSGMGGHMESSSSQRASTR